MKTTKMLTIFVMALGLVVCQVEVSKAEPMGTAWTYQGRLMDANVPSDGVYDFEFKIFDDPCTGAQQGGTVEAGDIDVIDGYFTVELDFGSDVFDGDARWLEVAVRPGDSNDANAFTTLITRQKVTPTPYAFYAKMAGHAKTAGHVEVADYANIADYATTAGYANTAGATVAGITGSGTTDYLPKFIDSNTIGDSVIYESGGNVGIGTTSPQAKLNIENSGDNTPGLRVVSGNNESAEVVYFSGNPSAGHDFVMKQSGNVGIGTPDPKEKLHVAGSARIGSGNPGEWAALSLFGDSQWLLNAHSSGDAFYLRHNTGTVEAPNWSDLFLTVLTNGDVGIGTTSPSAKLDVEGNIDVSSNRVKNYRGFPRPDYDSGWQSIPGDGNLILTHSLGGNVDNYVVDLQFKGTVYGIHNYAYGTDAWSIYTKGAYWSNLTTESIEVGRGASDLTVEYIRIRIWVYD